MKKKRQVLRTEKGRNINLNLTRDFVNNYFLQKTKISNASKNCINCTKYNFKTFQHS